MDNLIQPVVRNIMDELETLRAENKRLRTALEFYAEPETYEAKYPPTGFTARIDEDEGKRAREALNE